MNSTPVRRRASVFLIWSGLAIAIAAPIAIAATSPFLASRNGAYIVAGFAGIVGLALMLVQPLLAAGYLPGLRLPRARRWHRWLGSGIIAAVVLHVGGLYLTSPPDTLDALLLVSPTPFSVYGVTAMWGVIITAVLVAMRHRLGLGIPVWRIIHNGLAFIVVVATVVHAVQIEGTMGTVSKWALCAFVLMASGVALLDLRVIRPLLRKRAAAAQETRG